MSLGIGALVILRLDGKRFREQIVSVVWRPEPMSAIRKEIRREA